MKRRIENTGIYQTTHVSSGPALADQKAVFTEVKKAFAAAGDIDAVLNRIEQEAIKACKTERPEIKKDAEKALFDIGQLRTAIADDDTRAATHWALHLGSTAERLRIRPFEPLVQHGRKTLEAAAGARKTRTTKGQKQHEEFLRRVAAARQRNPHATKTTIQQRVADDMGIKWPTMYARLRRYGG